jgi:hypothetical protein
MKNILKHTTILILSVLTTTAFGLARAVSITATLEPSEISFGDTAQLTVTVQGRDADEPQIPSMSGLDFQPVGQSSQIQVINGAMSASVSYTYVVAPSQPGSFNIPAIKAGQGADAAASQPLVLKVSRSASGAPTINSPNQKALSSPAVGGNEGQISASEQQSFGFLRLVSPKKEFYVGEKVPVELKAFFRAGVELRVDGLPTLNSDAFTMNKLGNQPVSSRQEINGLSYTVLTWSTVITAVKAGDYEMSVEIPTTVTVRQQAQRPRLPGGPFDDEFFDQAFSNFFGNATQKQVVLNSDPNTVRILSLPSEKRPASFTGAVGQFDLAAETLPAQSGAGDPVTLKLKISGEGNFDRVSVPAVESSGVWKTYKPSAKFDPADSDGYSGTKLFEQALVPKQTGKLEIPALTFSYFDPEQKQYVIRTASPVTIEVAPGQPAETTATSASTTSPAASAAITTPSDLAPNKRTPDAFTTTLHPWFLNAWLVAGALLLAVAVLSAFFMHRRRQQLAHDIEHGPVASSQRLLGLQLEVMERAVAVGDTASFFSAACAAFQNLLGLRWSLPPRTITLAEINARMNGEAEGLRTIFGLADEAVYSGRAFAPDELRHLQTLVKDELKKLEAL